MTPRTLLFRADANIAMGTGHVMRCLALAQAWQDAGGRTAFAMAQTTASVGARLRAESCELVSISAQAATDSDAMQTVSVARNFDSRWIVIDGYQFDSGYQELAKSAGLKILFLDDYGHASHYFADLILNQNVGASPTLYEKREHYSELLLGPRYCMLRREFTRWRNWNRVIPPIARHLLVTIGGSDPANVTSQVLEALNLSELADVETTVVVGGSSPHSDELERFTARTGVKVTVRRDVTDMAELMARADVAISAAGSTCWEMCLLGLPAIIIAVAENQRSTAARLNEIGAALEVTLGPDFVAELATSIRQLLIAKDRRSQLSKVAHDLVDGQGTERVVRILAKGESIVQLA